MPRIVGSRIPRERQAAQCWGFADQLIMSLPEYRWAERNGVGPQVEVLRWDLARLKEGLFTGSVNGLTQAGVRHRIGTLVGMLSSALMRKNQGAVVARMRNLWNLLNNTLTRLPVPSMVIRPSTLQGIGNYVDG